MSSLRCFLLAPVFAATLFLFAAPEIRAEAESDLLLQQFENPPDSARPWVYWFWSNGNVTEEGIKADLAAMKEVGIGGAIIMDVLERFAPPAGDADYMSPKWRRLMKFALNQAREMGIELNVTNGPGWCGSSGPWITPELSMQTLVSSTVEATGKVSMVLPDPELPEIPKDEFTSNINRKPFYRDVAVLAFPKRAGDVPVGEVLDLTRFMSKEGKLEYTLPDGDWIIQRIGHASTGSSTRPPVKGGDGLEVDKFSAEAVALHFNQVIGMLAKESPGSKNGGLVATHVDSWEVGNQNWTTNFPAEFRKRRGYDLTKYLPNVAFPLPHAHIGGSAIPKDPPPHPIGAPEEVERFRRDFYQTCSELLSEKYIGTLAQLSHQNGLRFTMEGYNLPFGDESEYTAHADEPMTEFWSTGGMENARKAYQMASVAHTTGRRIIGAEAFTAGHGDRWVLHPALVKSMGDYQLSQGVNRFVFHRYAMQPYLDRFPGAAMGPWGMHYERTSTWWPMSGAWHKYLSRCQFMLRQGLYVADVLYLRHQRPNQTYMDHESALPEGFRSDDISVEQLIARAKVENGRITLPDGMSYAVLVLPSSPMTPDLVAKLSVLVKDGATILGRRPTISPSLSGYPNSDSEVKRISGEAWGDCNGTTVTEHCWGKGRVIDGVPIERVLEQLTGGPDFQSTTKLNWIHRKDGKRDIYFVANPNDRLVATTCKFRVTGKSPQLWDPETGRAYAIGFYRTLEGVTELRLALDRNQSVFVVFEPTDFVADHVVSLSRDGKPIDNAVIGPRVVIKHATYGPPGDDARTIDITKLLQDFVDRGETAFLVSKLGEKNDPAFGVVKTLKVEATVDGRENNFTGTDTDTFSLVHPNELSVDRTAIHSTETPGTFMLSTSESGKFQLTSGAGKTTSVDLPPAPEALTLRGPWRVSFPKKWGAPDEIQMPELASLSDSAIEGVRYFSGICTYETNFDFSPAPAAPPDGMRYWMDLGDVEVMAEVILNGKNLGVVWNRPGRIEITDHLKKGSNRLKVKVANTWQNRMIGDAGRPESQRYTWSSYDPFQPNDPLPRSGLLGPVTIEPQHEVTVQFK